MVPRVESSMKTVYCGGSQTTSTLDATPKTSVRIPTDPTLFKRLIRDFIKTEHNLFILGWIYKAKEIFSLSALETAVALFMKPGCRTLEELNKNRPKITEETFESLLGTVLAKEKLPYWGYAEGVTFADASVRKFFDQTRFLDSIVVWHDHDLEFSIARACVTYLSMDNFRELPVPPGWYGTRNDLAKSDEFLTYASRNWHKHVQNSTLARKLEPNLDRIIDPTQNCLYLWIDQSGSSHSSGGRTFLGSRSQVAIKYDLPWLALYLIEQSSSEPEDIFPAKDLPSLVAKAPKTLKLLFHRKPQYYRRAITKKVLMHPGRHYDGFLEVVQVLFAEDLDRRLPLGFFWGVANCVNGDKILEYLIGNMRDLPISRATLLSACENNGAGLKVLLHLFRKNPALKITSEMVAGAVGNPEVIKLLLMQDPDVVITEETLMRFVRMECRGESMKVLLDSNASIEITQTVVDMAVQLNRYEFIKLVFDKDPDIKITEDLLRLAAGSHGHELAMTEYLLSLDRCDHSFITENVISAATRRSNSSGKMTRLLLKHQPQFRISDELLGEARYGYDFGDVLGVFLDHQPRKEVPKAIVDAAIEQKLRSISWGYLKEYTPSILTVLKERVPNCSYLVQRLAETDFTPPPPKNEVKPFTNEDLPNAADYNDVEKVKKLLKAGLDINHQHARTCNCDGNKGIGTALQRAVSHNSIELTRLLLENGADPNLGHGKYGNPLQKASESGNIELVRLLLKYKADIHCPGHDHASALHAAAKADDIKVMHILLENGADTNITDSHGWNPYLHALAYQSHDATKYLRGYDRNIPALSELLALPPNRLVSTEKSLEYGIHVSEDGLILHTGTLLTRSKKTLHITNVLQAAPTRSKSQKASKSALTIPYRQFSPSISK